MRYALALVAALTATPALAQQDSSGQDGQTTPQPGQQGQNFPSPDACQAVRERVQLALSRADQALQGENDAGASQWAGAAADYAYVFETFCENAS